MVDVGRSLRQAMVVLSQVVIKMVRFYAIQAGACADMVDVGRSLRQAV
jgi:hypothetical protein